MAPPPPDQETLVETTAKIVTAYVSNNRMMAADLPSLITAVYETVAGVNGGGAARAAEPLKPSVSIKRSVTDDYIVCLEDGKKFKSLKRHLRTSYSLSPEQYRAKWGLPTDYPMVAPNYAAQRSKLAKAIGLGRTSARRKRR
ncbi:MAG: MucR family transcriptional regulator [Alphaproteobacteria bacterium]|nr:MucR family transcriptional regulator [Alphaproteobacteria bacterium]